MFPKHSVLVTGVSGFIGRYVARNFSYRGWRVLGVDRSAPENAPLNSLSLYQQINLPSEKLELLIKSYMPDVFVHCAGRASVGMSMDNPAVDFETNVVLTFNLLEILRRNAPECRFIFLSSAAVFGTPTYLPINEECAPNPLSPYGFHKWQSEQICLEFSKIYNVPTCSLRVFSAYGPGLRRQVLWDICYKILTGNSLFLQGTGNESRDFIHAVDIARAIEFVASNAEMQGEIYALGSGRETTIAELALLIMQSLNRQYPLEFSNEIPSGVPLNWRADISKLQRLGFEPEVTLEQGVKSYTDWCKAELTGYKS